MDAGDRGCGNAAAPVASLGRDAVKPGSAQPALLVVLRGLVRAGDAFQSSFSLPLTRCTQSSVPGQASPSTTRRARGCPDFHTMLPEHISEQISCPAASIARGEHDPKSRIATHHAIIGLSCALERIGLSHWPHTCQCAERKGLLRID
jgi:hypothetical protein